MAITTIHVSEDLLGDLDRAARALGMSRNRFIVEACRAALARWAGEWPEGFFRKTRPTAERELLEQATREMEHDIFQARRNRGAVAL